MSINVCVLAVPEPGREEGMALIRQRIYLEAEDVVKFEDEDGKVLLICTAILDVLEPGGAQVGRIETTESNATMTGATLVFRPTLPYAEKGLTELEAHVQHQEVFLKFERMLFRHYCAWMRSTWSH